MNNAEILRAKAIMCSEHDCLDCPLGIHNEIRDGYQLCGTYIIEHSETVAEIIEKWWNENKPKTNAEWVTNKLREIGFEVDEEWMREVCPVPRNTTFTNHCCHGDGLSCEECSKWWDEEHKE